MRQVGTRGAVLLLAATAAACDPAPCGPEAAVVVKVTDGDTVELADGTKVRYLGIDAPEDTSDHECWGPQATAHNRALVLDREVTLEYDAQCRDCFGRLLAYVWFDGRMVNETLLRRGLGCLFSFAPNHAHRARLAAAEKRARASGLEMWGSCSPIPCTSSDSDGPAPCGKGKR